MYRLNHMAMTVPFGTITPEWIADLKAFYGGIFGWDVAVVRTGTDPSLPVHHLYLQLEPSGQQYLYIGEGAHPMDPAGIDHLGIIVESQHEVEALFAQCKAFKQRDTRVALNENQSTTPFDPEGDPSFTLQWDNGWVPPYLVSGFNVSFLLPVGWDVQFETYKPGVEPPKVWQFA
jgi:hypothetical protein